MKSVVQLESQLSVHLPDLSSAQRTGLAFWVVGTVLAGSACLNAVFSILASEMADHGRLRQRLRMWLRDRPSTQGWYSGPAVEVRSCFGPLLRWILSLWQGSELVLALDPTTLRDRVTCLAVSVAGALGARGCALPVAWQVVPAQEASGSWVEAYCGLLQLLAPAIPRHMTVTALCDRGLASPRLWQAICGQGWHVYMRYQRGITFQSQAGARRPVTAWVTQPGQSRVEVGTALGHGRQRRCTLVAVWGADQQQPWFLLTDLPPAAVSLRLYGLRVWVEQGFRILKREGWHWHRTRRLAPRRADRHWLVMAIATLLTLAHGTRVEDAQRLGRHPWRLTPLRRLCYQGRTWQGLWLWPEATGCWPLQPTPT